MTLFGLWSYELKSPDEFSRPEMKKFTFKIYSHSIILFFLIILSASIFISKVSVHPVVQKVYLESEKHQFLKACI